MIRLAIRAAIDLGNTAHLEHLLSLADYDVDRDWIIVEASKRRRDQMVAMLAERGWLGNQLSEADLERLNLMADTLAQGEAAFRPSDFWTRFNGVAKEHMKMVGIANFKRSINQMYCNYIPQTTKDPQIKELKIYRSSDPKRAKVELQDPDNDPDLWFTNYEPLKFFSGDARRKRYLYLVLVSRLYNYLDEVGLGAHADTLSEPVLGNPIRMTRDGQLVSQDLATSLDEWGFVERMAGSLTDPPARRIAEFGAGYGRLAYVFLKKSPARYFIFDIPPALRIAEWYLTNVFPEKNVFAFRDFKKFEDVREELEGSDIAFFTANQISQFPDGYFDLFVNVSSLHEMKGDQINNYMSIMDKKTSGHIFIKQYYEYVNPYDETVIARDDYDFPPHWRVIGEEQAGSNPRFFQMVFANTVQLG